MARTYLAVTVRNLPTIVYSISLVLLFVGEVLAGNSKSSEDVEITSSVVGYCRLL